MEKTNTTLPDLDFTVMPELGTENTPPQEPPKIIEPKTPGKPKNWSKYGLWILAAVAVIVLGYFATKNIEWLKDKFRPGVAENDVSVPAPDAGRDTDEDGLADVDEKTLGSDINKADTDGDGLADGDEKNVYGSDPLRADTDTDTYDDGQEVANGYSPVSNKPGKASDEERQRWLTAAAGFSLHEPTIATLATKSTPAEVKMKTYQNKTYKYQIALPEIFAVREADSGTKVGIYISGQVPDDTDVISDPMSIQAAANASGGSLLDWVKSQYQTDDYQKLDEAVIGSLPVIRASNMPGDSCTSNRAFFSRDSTVIILTWTCNEIAAYGPYFEQIVSSFKFTK